MIADTKKRYRQDQSVISGRFEDPFIARFKKCLAIKGWTQQTALERIITPWMDQTEKESR